MDEAGLIEAVRQRSDHDAFRILVEAHASRVHRIVAAVLGPFRDLAAEDTAQEVFLKAYSSLAQFRGESSFGSWLNSIAYRTAVEARRSGRMRAPHDELPEMAGQRERFEERIMVAAALETLPEPYRSVVSMHYWMGFTVEEIAGIIGAPAGTVKSYLSRARDRLRKELES